MAEYDYEKTFHYNIWIFFFAMVKCLFAISNCGKWHETDLFDFNMVMKTAAKPNII